MSIQLRNIACNPPDCDSYFLAHVRLQKSWTLSFSILLGYIHPGNLQMPNLGSCTGCPKASVRNFIPVATALPCCAVGIFTVKCCKTKINEWTSHPIGHTYNSQLQHGALQHIHSTGNQCNWWYSLDHIAHSHPLHNTCKHPVKWSSHDQQQGRI